MNKIDYSSLTKTVNQFVSKFGCTAEPGLEFVYYDDNTIQYSIIITDEFSESFKDFADSLGFPKDLEIFVLSILHELGHHNTLELVPKHIKIINHLIKKIYNILIRINYEWVEKLSYKYYNLYVEKVATWWAVQYARDHHKALLRFQQDIARELNSLYEKIELEESLSE